LDFGTSSTKIAYRITKGGLPQVIPMVFPAKYALAAEPYCLPNLAAVDDEGTLLVGAEASTELQTEPWDRGMRRVKVLVAGEVDGRFQDAGARDAFERESLRLPGTREWRPCDLMATMVAYQMEFVRSQLTEEYPNNELNINFNLCVPIDHVENNDVLAAYRRIADVAQRLEHEYLGRYQASGDHLECAAILFDEETGIEPEERRVHLFPEAVAQVATYMASLQARSGLHALIDFGAGTTDFSIFILVDPRSDSAKSEWLASSNFPVGTHKIEGALAEYLRGECEDHSRSAVIAIMRQLQTRERDLQDKATTILEELKHDMNPTWVEAYRKYKVQSAFQGDAVQVFYTGGGALLPGVERIFCRSYMQNDPEHPIAQVPAPKEYEKRNPAVPFHRMSVAFGLTVPMPVLAEYVLPADVRDRTPKLQPVDWDQRSAVDTVYPTTDW